MKTKSHILRPLAVSIIVFISSFIFIIPANAQDVTTKIETKGQTKKWHFEIAPYFWAPSIYSDVVLGPVTVNTKTPFNEIFSNLTGVFLFHFEFGKGKWTVLTDVLYLQDELTQTAQYTFFPKLPNISTIDFEAGFTLTTLQLEALGAYRLTSETSNNKVEVMVGMRYTQIKDDLRLTEESFLDTLYFFPIKHTTTYIDPLIGARYKIQFHKKWGFDFRADIGGFSVGSKFTSNLLARLSFEATRFLDLQLGYRWLYSNYDNGKTGIEHYENKSNELGPMFFAAFKF
ncbi:hypothetical protein [Lentimicrobium sp. S6]|uniref:hypothetical protein n=1 Tax=Lentimicrobium sp. S6 TaxID=2735872 RepID=UPI001557181A|nr:hypothetical protein [Lentimicrobium sp. S6]NPD47741.1 hypothetical protein [Lentimicrobium sp. S6]